MIVSHVFAKQELLQKICFAACTNAHGYVMNFEDERFITSIEVKHAGLQSF